MPSRLAIAVMDSPSISVHKASVCAQGPDFSKLFSAMTAVGRCDGLTGLGVTPDAC